MIHINHLYEKIKRDEKNRRYEEQMFQKDYNRDMRSSESEEPSSEEQSASFPIIPGKGGRVLKRESRQMQ